jgi:hypothetical protein
MKQLKQIAAAVAVMVAGFTASSQAQTNVVFVTNAYDVRVQQASAGTLSDGTRYASFAGEAKAVNNKLAADLKTFAFTVFYAVDPSGVATVTGGTFLVQTTNKDRSPLVVGGDILPGDTVQLRSNGWIAVGETLSLPLQTSDGSDVSGLLTVTIDKSTPPRPTGRLTLTYPVVQ